MNALTEPFSLLYRHRQMLWSTTWNDIRMRFAGSILGLTWLVLYPLLLLGAYAAVYVYIFQVRFAMMNSTEYVALIFCGLVPFIGFSEAISLGLPSVTQNSNLIKNTLFPIDLIPAKAVLASQTTQLAGFGILLIALTLMGNVSIWWCLLLPIWACQLAFTLGLVWILSSLNVYFRDLQNGVGIVIMLAMMISPIAYTPEMIPAALRPVLMLNPLFYFITAYQQSLMQGRCPDGFILAMVGAMAALSLTIGYAFFRRMKSLFVDNV